MTTYKTKLTTIAVLVAATLAGVSGCNNDSSNTNTTTTKDNAYYKKLAENIVSKMTADEKIKMLIGPGYTDTVANTVNLKSSLPGAAGYINGVKNEASGLDVPATKLVDGPAGIRIDPLRDGESGTFYATAFPTGTVLASTWNPDLVKKVGEAAGEEGREYGADFWLAPGMNIQRNPLNGRNFEYYSEDPLVAGVIAAAIVDGSEEKGFGTTIKHFAANNSETNRRTVNAVVSPRALREIYLRGFEYVIEKSQPWALMTSYNSINGVNSGERSDLMTDILRNEWGFEGLAMSDWWSGWDPVKLVTAGTNVIQPGGAYRITRSNESWLTSLQNAYQEGKLSDDVINKDVVTTLTQVLKTPSAQSYSPSNSPNLNAHALLSKEAALEGMVLLRNQESALPLTKSSKVASFGIGQLNTLKGGTGSGDVRASYTKKIIDGLSNKFTIDSTLETYYREYFADPANCVVTTDQFGVSPVTNCTEASITPEQASTAADSNDVAVITISRNAGEGSDRKAVAGDYLLSDVETALIDNVTSAFKAQNKKVIVVLNTAGIIDTTSWKDKVDGILLAYLPGQEVGDAISDILAGDANPSGKLAQSFPASYSDVPSSDTFPGKTESTYNNAGPIEPYQDTTKVPVAADYNEYYNEDIYVGYRYYNTFNKAVNYPFGFGLSYTTFAIEDTAVTANNLDSKGANGSITVTATVKNTGSLAGKEVAQVYINAPEVKLKKPEIELKAFAKTDKLDAGTSQQLSFSISAETLASFDETSNQWIVEPGTYSVYVNDSSDVSAIKAVTFTVSKEIVVSKTTPGALALQEQFKDKSFITIGE